MSVGEQTQRRRPRAGRTTGLVAGLGRRQARDAARPHARLVGALGADRDGRELERRHARVQLRSASASSASPSRTAAAARGGRSSRDTASSTAPTRCAILPPPPRSPASIARSLASESRPAVRVRRLLARVARRSRRRSPRSSVLPGGSPMTVGQAATSRGFAHEGGTRTPSASRDDVEAQLGPLAPAAERQRRCLRDRDPTAGRSASVDLDRAAIAGAARDVAHRGEVSALQARQPARPRVHARRDHDDDGDDGREDEDGFR